MQRIMQLDQQFPGLANQVRTWFDQGVIAKDVARRLWERYQIRVTRNVVGYFRTQYWARQREREQTQRIEAAAKVEFDRLLQMKRQTGVNFPGTGQ